MPGCFEINEGENVGNRVIRFANWDDLDWIDEILRVEFSDRPKEVREWKAGIEANLSMMLVFLEGSHGLGCAGLQFHRDKRLIFHSDLVAPSRRRSGIGKALFFARLCLLDGAEAPYRGGLLAIDRNIPFYQNCGFSLVKEPETDHLLGWRLGWMERDISDRDIENAKLYLDSRGIKLAEDQGPASIDEAM
jgi:N-acetylglutamate synthase-like GNAT family acetyltransferase